LFLSVPDVVNRVIIQRIQIMRVADGRPRVLMACCCLRLGN